MIKSQLESYIKAIFKTSQQGDAREESYYPALKDLLEDYAASAGYNKAQTTSQPKKTEAGNPDFRVWDGTQHKVGYIEAKAPTVNNLGQIETSDQLKRYLYYFPNVILTNFFEFRLYRDGNLIDTVSIGNPFTMTRLNHVPTVENEAAFAELLDKFFSFSIPRTYTAKSLAVELAKKTKYLRDEIIAEELKEEEGRGSKPILGFYEAFHKHLIFGLTKEDFADLYAQTITYGLFAARTRAKNGFNRLLAFDNIPRTIGILRDIFRFISSADLPQQMEWPIDDIAEILSVADVSKILHKYYHEGKGKDPIIHFYETFLAEYDPKMREKRGVYYTPEPVVSYIVRSLNIILKEYFGKQDGFASKSVRVLDPAAGTMTFIAEAVKLAVDETKGKFGSGHSKESLFKGLVKENFYAFELMMAPYAVGHIKMSFLLEELGYKLEGDDRFNLYLTNTLEMEDLKQTNIPGMASLSEESRLAGKVKKEVPILVILGNPPYSGISANMRGWITEKIEDYKYVDGKHFKERKHWLQNDYVKFIRFAQWKIDQAGEGVLGFITDNSYLDGTTFRGMRQSLMNSFDEIYVLDLHGNSNKKEKCPDGSKDENVFDIQQGVAIALFIKKKGLNKKITHFERWGLREDKYDWLLEHNLKTTEWNELKPNSPFYFFIPRDEKYREIYESYWKITDIFPENCAGIVTARDKFVIDFDNKILKRRVEMFRSLSIPDESIKQSFKLKDTSTFNLKKSRENLAKDDNWLTYFTEILYRPFDIREIYYTGIVVERPLIEVMRHMLAGENLGLIATRQTRDKWDVFVTSHICGHKSCAAYDINSLFPLYLYPNTDKKHLFSHIDEHNEKQPNINPELIETLTNTYSNTPPPEDIFYYIYAVLYADTYRSKYSEFLKTDFPRVPFTKDYSLFVNMGKLGKRLIDLHLLKSKELNPPIAKFEGTGNNMVEKPVYKDNCVHINKGQYFEGISQDVWEYQIGGYQVLAKWLKDRKKKELSLDEIKHYCYIVTSISKTITLQAEIDNIYPDVEKETI